MWKHICLIIIVLMLPCQFQANAQPLNVEPYDTPGVVFAPLSSGMTICAINLRDAEPQWFLLSSTGNTQLGSISSAFGMINTIKASPDGQYLAVVSVGEGHAILEVVELSTLIQQKTYRVVQQIDPYPGIISLEAWKGMDVHVRSDMLLTHLDPSTGRVPDTMTLGWEETFALNVLTGSIAGVSDGAKNPAGHYVKVLLDPSTSEADKDAALMKLLRSGSEELALTELIKILEQERDPKRMNKLLDLMGKLQGK